MKAVRFSEYGGPEVLQVDEVDEVGGGVVDPAAGDEVFGSAVGGGTAGYAGSLDRVVTMIADFINAAEHGVRVTTGSEGRAWDALGAAARRYEDGRFTMPVAQTFSFAQAPEAHRRSEGGHVRGKLVITAESLRHG